jgi:heat shock protein HslJ
MRIGRHIRTFREVWFDFMGGFEMKEGNRITLTQMASTMMACENMEMEMTFLQTLQQVDNYAMKDNVLSLNRAKMSPLLKFTAVDKEVSGVN